jgi:hypothetical protein
VLLKKAQKGTKKAAVGGSIGCLTIALAIGIGIAVELVDKGDKDKIGIYIAGYAVGLAAVIVFITLLWQGIRKQNKTLKHLALDQH